MELDLATVGIMCLGLFLLLMFLQMPIGASMLLSGFIGLWIIRGMPAALSSIGFIVARTASIYILSIIPLFVLMGMLATYSELSTSAYSTLQKWLGRLPGGLAIATIGAGAAFGAVCGNSIACSATLVSAALPEMRKYGYSDKLSLGSIISAGNLGILIPPSGAFIVYGFITEQSIGALFVAGILPGLLLTFLFCLQIFIQCRLDPNLAPQGPSVSWKEKLIASKDIVGILAAFILVIGGMYLGIFTPAEGASVGVAVIFLLGLINRKLTFRGFTKSLLETGEVTALVIFLIFGAMVFSSFTTTTQIAFKIAEIIGELAIDRWVILAIVIVIYLVAGCFMDIFATLIITLPIIFPIITDLGFDPLHFGVLCVFTIMIGDMTPPVGLLVISVFGMIKGEVPVSTMFIGCMPFIVTMVFCLVLVIAFPQISTFLPTLAYR